MRKSKWGRVVDIGSMAASLEPMGDSVYAACKAGVATLANVMAKEFGSFGVTCNTLAISAIESDMLSQLPRDKIDAIIAGLPVPRFAAIEDITNVIDFFCGRKQQLHHRADDLPGGVRLTASPVTLTPVGPGAWQVTAGVSRPTATSIQHDPEPVCSWDPGLDPQGIDEQLGTLGLRPVAVLCTHGHFDHVGGASRSRVPLWHPGAPAAGRCTDRQGVQLPVDGAAHPGAHHPGRFHGGGTRPRHCAGRRGRLSLPPLSRAHGTAIICIDGYGFSGDSIYARGVGLSRLPGRTMPC